MRSIGVVWFRLNVYLAESYWGADKFNVAAATGRKSKWFIGKRVISKSYELMINVFLFADGLVTSRKTID